jgi:periplasmic protein TonB
VLAALVLLIWQGARGAAQDRVYSPEQLTEMPKFASPTDAVSAIDAEYPADLKASGVGGKVQLRLILGADGTVEPSSVKIVATTNPKLGDAAARAVKRIRFEPGKVNGKPVRTVVLFPLTFGG